MVNNMVARRGRADCRLQHAQRRGLSKAERTVARCAFDRHMNDSTLPLVLTDSITPTATLVSDIARQHPDEFYFLGGQPRLSPTRDRLEGFKQGLRDAGVELRPEWIIHGNYHPSSGYEMFAELCALGRPPKALLPPPAVCWKGCCAIWGNIICCKAICVWPALTITISMIL